MHLDCMCAQGGAEFRLCGDSTKTCVCSAHFRTPRAHTSSLRAEFFSSRRPFVNTHTFLFSLPKGCENCTRGPLAATRCDRREEGTRREPTDDGKGPPQQRAHTAAHNTSACDSSALFFGLSSKTPRKEHPSHPWALRKKTRHAGPLHESERDGAPTGAYACVHPTCSNCIVASVLEGASETCECECQSETTPSLTQSF